VPLAILSPANCPRTLPPRERKTNNELIMTQSRPTPRPEPRCIANTSHSPRPRHSSKHSNFPSSRGKTNSNTATSSQGYLLDKANVSDTAF
jgi:hypothetical protein